MWSKKQKKLKLTPEAQGELSNLCAAVERILMLSSRAFMEADADTAAAVDALEQVIDELKEACRSSCTLTGSSASILTYICPQIFSGM